MTLLNILSFSMWGNEIFLSDKRITCWHELFIYDLYLLLSKQMAKILIYPIILLVESKA